MNNKTYELLHNVEDRLGFGEVTTPVSLVEDILSTLPKEYFISSTTTFLDPCFGNGTILIEIIKKLRSHGHSMENIESRVHGYEISVRLFNKVQKLLSHYNFSKLYNRDFLNTGLDMKFDIVIGNPPYQEGEKAASYKPIYNLFMEKAYEISDKSIFITPARFLFNAGSTPKKWNEKMLNDDHLKVVWYESDSNKVFPNVDIKGGIVITLRDSNQIFGKIGTFSAHNELNSVCNKISSGGGFAGLSDIFHLQNKFNLEILYEDYPEFKDIVGSNGREKRLITSIFTQLNIFSNEPINEDDIRIFGLINNKRVYRWVPKRYLLTHENLYKYKVLVPAANGTGKLGEVLSTPIVMKPNTGFTSSFISFGSLSNGEQANSLLKYLKTKFTRALLGVLKVTQHNSRVVWDKIPIQDFTYNSDIDWTKSISDIDQQMYIKYNLSEEEVSFIESNIKPMN